MRGGASGWRLLAENRAACFACMCLTLRHCPALQLPQHPAITVVLDRSALHHQDVDESAAS